MESQQLAHKYSQTYEVKHKNSHFDSPLIRVMLEYVSNKKFYDICERAMHISLFNLNNKHNYKFNLYSIVSDY